MRSRHLSSSTLVAMLVAAAPMMAQGVSSQASGFVLSRDGVAVAAAKVTIRNAETGLVRTVATDAKGRYMASLLPVGPYTITVEKDGFQTAANIKVNLTVADSASTNIRLAPLSGSTVEVMASTPQIDSERANATAYVSPDALANLPVFNRSFTSLATLAPQVVVDSSRGNLAIAGQRGVNTSINIDGGDNNEPFFGGALGAAEGKTPFTISIEAIREYQVVTDGASAEFGRMGGGYVNAITKNGTNELTGGLFLYERPKSMVARQPNLNGVANSNAVADFKQQQFGFSVGGPIMKDKLFYFVAYDAQRRTDPINFNWGGATPVALNATTNPNDAALISRAGNYEPKANSDTVFARVDWNVATDHLLQLRLNSSNFKGDAYTGTTSAYENSISDDIKTLALVGQWNWTIGTNWMNELRMNTSKDEMPRSTRATIPQVSISNVGYYGANPYPRQYETKRFQFSDSISYVETTFQAKAGVDYNRISISEIFSSFSQGGYTFNDSGSGATFVSALNNFRAGNWAKYSQRFSLDASQNAWSAGSFDATEKQIAAFIQVDFRPADSLKIGVGARWDRQVHPDFAVANFSDPMAATIPVNSKIPTDNHFSPRLSFVWTPDADNSMVVRGSAGRYVSPTPSVFLYQAYTVNGVRMAQVDFAPAQAVAAGIPIGAGFNPDNPFRLATLPTSGATLPKSDIFTFDPNFRNPTTDRMNLGVERSIWNGWVFGISGSYAMGHNLERLKDINLGTPVASTSGRLIFPATRPNVNFAKMMVYSSDGESRYSALTLSAKYQASDSPFSAQMFYTYSQNRDNDSNERNFSGYSTQNTQNLDADWSWADTDRRHVLTGQLTYIERQWTGIQIGMALRYLTATPYSLTYSGDINRDGTSGNDRVYVGGVDSTRNSMRGTSNTTLDLKLSREFALFSKAKIQVSAEVFNLLNRHDTWTQTYVTGSDTVPVFNSRNVVTGSARQVQLGARLSF